MANTSERLCSRKVNNDFCIAMHLEERRRDSFRSFVFHRSLHNLRLIFAPCHTNHFLSRKDVTYTESNSGSRSRLKVIRAGNATTRYRVDESETTSGCHRRPRTVESDISGSTNLAKHEIQTATSVNFSFIFATSFKQVAFFYFLIKRMDIFSLNIHLTEEEHIQTVQSTGIALDGGIKLKQIKNNHL